MRSLYMLITVTTLAVVIYVSLTQLTGYFPIIFSAFLICQGLLICMVYKILKDNYSTQRTFNDWYGDKDNRRES